MKSTVTVEINLPREKVDDLFTDPRNSTLWMNDVDRIEVVSGQLGMPGSKYRLVPRKGNMVFVATVLSRDLPNEARLVLDSPNVVVSVTGTFQSHTANRTLLISNEVFRFKGAISAIFGFFEQIAIRKAHRRHIEAFKAFAETHR